MPPMLILLVLTFSHFIMVTTTKARQQRANFILQAVQAVVVADMALMMEISTTISPSRSTVTTRTGGGKGRVARGRNRRSVEHIYCCLGPTYFRRSYRMPYETFLLLHEKLKEGIQRAFGVSTAKGESSSAASTRSPSNLGKGNFKTKGGSPNYKPPPVPNGLIATTVRLACAIRYFAGGSPYDLMAKYGISHSEVLASVWYVVEAVNSLRELFIQYPSGKEEQQQIANGFRLASSVDFDNCAGAIDGILIWIQKPTVNDAEDSGIGIKKLYCARKHKFGLNCQAVSDKRGRFLDISIKYGGSSADCLAFEASDLFERLEAGLLHSGLVLFGDNAYLNSPYMATPYTNVSGGSRDNYNFYHSQVKQADSDNDHLCC
jgi:hypothetical protein